MGWEPIIRAKIIICLERKHVNPNPKPKNCSFIT